jgi:hypothetical protein
VAVLAVPPGRVTSQPAARVLRPVERCRAESFRNFQETLREKVSSPDPVMDESLLRASGACIDREPVYPVLIPIRYLAGFTK